MFDECNSDNLKGSATLSSTCVPLNSFWSTCHFCPCAAVTTSSHNRPELGRCPPSPVAAAPLRTFLPAPAVRSWGSSPRQCLGWINKEKKKEREREKRYSKWETNILHARSRSRDHYAEIPHVHSVPELWCAMSSMIFVLWLQTWSEATKQAVLAWVWCALSRHICSCWLSLDIESYIRCCVFVCCCYTWICSYLII